MARGNGLHHSKDYLRRRYVMEKKSIDDIAKECGVTIQVIYTQLKKFGLKR